jgi:transcriptional regulator with PAS, ATPase and Fis domain
MQRKQWLISWIGRTDHSASRGELGDDIGPIATALETDRRFDRIYLLTNYDHDDSASYCDWLSKRTGYRDDQIDLFDIELSSPVDYDEIYAKVARNLQGAKLPREDVELTFHLSPGTPAMTVIWIVLARTRFPARLIQTARGAGTLEVEFFTDVASAFLPEYLQRSSARMETLAKGPDSVPTEFSGIVHRSAEMRRQITLAKRVAAFDVPVLILGETGTGKELFAKAIHAASGRASGRYIAVNCGAIPRELANSELFGHVKGSFTGATANRTGHFLEASGGTLFLDEIGDLPLDTQVRLLRALQEKEIVPVGSSKPLKIDVRVLAATHRDLQREVSTGAFREDLFHRLAVGILRLPPVRERDGDLELLAEYFIKQINESGNGKPEALAIELSQDARLALREHSWPGNVRELYHTLTRASIWAESTSVGADELRAAMLKRGVSEDWQTLHAVGPGFSLQQTLDELKRQYIEHALQVTGGNKARAARLLGVKNHQTLLNWMKALEIGDTPIE